MASRDRTLVLVDWDERANDPSRPDPWWRAASIFLAPLFTRTVRVKAIGDAYEALRRFDPRPGDEVQTWCHSGPGRPVLAGEDLDENHPVWRQYCGGADVWIRGCGALSGKEGHRFALKLADAGVNIAGHLSNIGALTHPHLVGLRAGHHPWWPANLNEDNLKTNTRAVSPLTMRLPAWAFKPSRIVV